jgi:hypothetical protein
MCSLQISLVSKCSPRYFIVLAGGNLDFILLDRGAGGLCSVPVRYDDLVSLTFISHFWSHLLKIWSYSCRFVETRKTFI